MLRVDSAFSIGLSISYQSVKTIQFYNIIIMNCFKG